MMERIKIHDKYFRSYISNSTIEEAISKTAEKINKDYGPDSGLVILGVLNGSFMFTASLVQKLDMNPEICFIRLASYEGLKSTGEIKEIIGLNRDISGRKVLVCEDIVDSGQTIDRLYDILTKAGVTDIKVATLFLKPDAYKGKIHIDYPAMYTGNEFIVGYGLDYNQLGRNLKDIYILDE